MAGFLRDELAQSAFVNARRSLKTTSTREKSEELRHRRELILGMAEYRSGNFTEALGLFERAREAFNLNCSGTAEAFGAMAAHCAASDEQAVKLLDEATQIYEQLLERNADDLGPHWRDTAILQIALAEAMVVFQTNQTR